MVDDVRVIRAHRERAKQTSYHSARRNNNKQLTCECFQKKERALIKIRPNGPKRSRAINIPVAICLEKSMYYSDDRVKKPPTTPIYDECQTQ